MNVWRKGLQTKSGNEYLETRIMGTSLELNKIFCAVSHILLYTLCIVC
jgi:hypothetical protein